MVIEALKTCDSSRSDRSKLSKTMPAKHPNPSSRHNPPENQTNGVWQIMVGRTRAVGNKSGNQWHFLLIDGIIRINNGINPSINAIFGS